MEDLHRGEGKTVLDGACVSSSKGRTCIGPVRKEILALPCSTSLYWLLRGQ